MPDFAIKVSDHGPNGTVKGDTFGDLKIDTPASRMIWAAMYMMATPELQMLMASNIIAFRAKRLEQEAAMEQARAEGREVAIHNDTDEIVEVPVEARDGSTIIEGVNLSHD